MNPHDLKITKAEEKAYFAAAASWDDDRVESALKSRKTAWGAFWLVLLVAAVEALALALLVPLKRTDAYLVRVDSSTGIVDNVVRVADTKLSSDEIMTRYFLRKYVVLRESYTRAQLQPNYEQVFLLTDPKLRPALRKEFELASPTSPYKKYGDLGVAEVKIKNISFIAPNIGQVRYYVVAKVGGSEITTHKIATLEFHYVAAPASEEARGVNPLGFQVTNWRADPEAVFTEETK